MQLGRLHGYWLLTSRTSVSRTTPVSRRSCRTWSRVKATRSVCYASTFTSRTVYLLLLTSEARKCSELNNPENEELRWEHETHLIEQGVYWESKAGHNWYELGVLAGVDVEILDYLKAKFPKLYRPKKVVDKLTGTWATKGPAILKLYKEREKRWWELLGSDDEDSPNNAIENKAPVRKSEIERSIETEKKMYLENKLDMPPTPS